MPEVLVTTTAAKEDDGIILLRERVRSSDFETEHFRRQLAERIGWAVADAELLESTSVEARSAGVETVEHEPTEWDREGSGALALAGLSLPG